QPRPPVLPPAGRRRLLPSAPHSDTSSQPYLLPGSSGAGPPPTLSADIVLKVNREIGEFLKDPAIQQKLILFGLANSGAGTPESTAQSIREMQEHWRAAAGAVHTQPP